MVAVLKTQSEEMFWIFYIVCRWWTSSKPKRCQHSILHFSIKITSLRTNTAHPHPSLHSPPPTHFSLNLQSFWNWTQTYCFHISFKKSLMILSIQVLHIKLNQVSKCGRRYTKQFTDEQICMGRVVRRRVMLLSNLIWHNLICKFESHTLNLNAFSFFHLSSRNFSMYS